jgi:hypothetical protein
MSVGSGVPYNEHTGNGVSDTFAYGFTLLDEGDFIATIDGVETSAYTLTGIGEAAGGNCVFDSAPADGAEVLLRRVVELVRETEYQNNGALQSETVNNDIDRLLMSIQQVSADVGGALRAPFPDQMDALPPAAERLGLQLMFHPTTGQPFLAAPVSGSAADVLVQLASSASDIVGAGIVGYDQFLDYTGLTIAAAVRTLGINANAVAGVDPTGVADSSAGFISLFSQASSGMRIRLFGEYKVSAAVAIAGKNFLIDAEGATFNLDGNSAGFKVNGAVTYFRVFGGRYIGDAVNRDGAPSTAQICWTFGNDSGAQVSNAVVVGAFMSSANVGLKFADGRGGGGTKARNCHAIGCHAYNMVGTVGGVGYGFSFSQADGSGVTACVADTCGRHGFYFSEGRGYTATNVQTRNCGSGIVRGAFSVSRSAQVSIAGYVAEDNSDVGLVIDTDSQGLAPDNLLDGVFVSGYVAYGNTLGHLRIGTSATPATDGVPKNVTVRMRCREASGATASAVVVQSGNRIKIYADIDGSAAAAGYRAVTFSAVGGATYSSDMELYGSIDSPSYGIQVASAIQTGTQRFLMKPDRINCTTADYEFLAGEDATTNPDLRYFLRNGAKPRRTYSSSGAAVTIPAGGLGAITLSASGATTIAGFSGLTEGEELTVHAANGNSTLTNSGTLQLDGAANITMTSADVLRLQYINGALRQVAKISLN